MRPKGISRIDWMRYNFQFFLEHLMGSEYVVNKLSERRKALFSKIDSRYKDAVVEGVEVVEQLSNDLSAKELRKKCYLTGEPKVFRGAAKDWEAIRKWDFDFFDKNYGNEEVILNDNQGISPQEFQTLKLSDYIQMMREGSENYLRFSHIVNEHDELKKAFDLEWLRKFSQPFSWGQDLKFFMGNKGSLTPLHVGVSSVLFIQVYGRKKWTLYPPNNRIFLDARTTNSFYFNSDANPYNLDDPNFPLIKYANRHEVILEPGDVLWFPSFYWYYVENLTDSIGIRYGESNIMESFRSSKMLSLLIALSSNPNIFSHLIASLKKEPNPHLTKSQKSK